MSLGYPVRRAKPADSPRTRSAYPKPRSSRRKTLRDLYQVDHRAELVDGRIITMSPVGRRANRAASRIFLSLNAYEQATRRGEAYTDQVAFVAKLPNRGTFSPDASYYDGPPPSDPDGFLPGPPGFAAEVRSKRDYGKAAERRLARKRKDYFAAGTKVVWDVDPVHETIAVYRAAAPERPTVYRVDQIADAEPAVPGWRMAVREVFG